MGNLLGQPFDKFVNEQIRIRQRIHGDSERSIQDIQYLNSRNAWIKLASSCLLNKKRLAMFKGNPLISTTPGGATAQNNVLFSGLSDSNNIPREGITGPNRAYGVGGTDQFGYSPMPGIIDMNFKCLNRGSIKKATLTIKAHNRNQFDMIDVLYMRLGYSVMLEWGYDKYMNNNRNLVQAGPSIIDEWFFKTKTKNYRDAIVKIQEKRKQTQGNYDAAFGVISNFSWSFASDGTYDIKLEIISMGDIIESLRMNLPSTILDTKDVNVNKLKGFATLLEKNGGDDVSKSDFYGNLYPGLRDAIENWWNGVQNGTYKWNNKEMTPPAINAGSSYVRNWTGRKGVDSDDPLTSDFRSYGSSWIYESDNNLEPGTSGSLPVLYNTDGTIYINPDISKIDPGFTFDDQKLAATWNGIYKAFSAGKRRANAQAGNSKTTTQNIIDSPFGDDFVVNMKKLLLSNGYQQEPVFDENGVGTQDVYVTKSKLPYMDKGTLATADVYYEVEENDNKAGQHYENNFREVWTKTFKDLSTKSISSAWKLLLNNQIGDNNYSRAIGITLESIYQSVYDEFVNRKIADAFPGGKEEEAKAEEFEKKTEDGGELSEAEEREKELNEQKLQRKTKDYVTKNKNRIYRYFYDIRQRYENKSGTSLNIFGGSIDGVSGAIGHSYDLHSIVKLDIEPLDNQWYIKLGDFLTFLNNKVIPHIDNDNVKEPIIRVDNDMGTNICYIMDNVYSLNPKKIIVSNPNFIIGKNNSGGDVVAPLFKKLPSFTKVEKELKWGKIMNIYFNFNRLEEIFDSTVANEDVSLYNCLKLMCDDINESLGGINNLEPIVDESNEVKFIDQSPIPNLSQIAVKLGLTKFGDDYKKNEVRFEVYGINKNKSREESNFVRDVGLTTQISKNYATMITIGATANGSVPGTEATAFSRWNVGIQDRFKKALVDAEEKEPPVAPISSSVGIQQQDAYAELLASRDDVFQRYGFNNTNDELKTVNDDFIKFNISTVSDFYSLIQAQNSFEKDENGNPKNDIESSVGFLPFNLKLTMDGISGIQIYNRIKIQQSFLPSNYPDTLEFIVTQVNHKLSGNDWITDLETTATSKSVMTK